MKQPLPPDPFKPKAKRGGVGEVSDDAVKERSRALPPDPFKPPPKQSLGVHGVEGAGANVEALLGGGVTPRGRLEPTAKSTPRGVPIADDVFGAKPLPKWVKGKEEGGEGVVGGMGDSELRNRGEAGKERGSSGEKGRDEGGSHRR